MKGILDIQQPNQAKPLYSKKILSSSGEVVGRPKQSRRAGWKTYDSLPLGGGQQHSQVFSRRGTFVRTMVALTPYTWPCIKREVCKSMYSCMNWQKGTSIPTSPSTFSKPSEQPPKCPFQTKSAKNCWQNQLPRTDSSLDSRTMTGMLIMQRRKFLDGCNTCSTAGIGETKSVEVTPAAKTSPCWG